MGEGIRVTIATHGDVVRRPWADTRQLAEVFDDAVEGYAPKKPGDPLAWPQPESAAPFLWHGLGR